MYSGGYHDYEAKKVKQDDTKLILQLIKALRDGQLETHAVLKRAGPARSRPG
jgi:hypothetical protein